jgi:hypothetical protein
MHTDNRASAGEAAAELREEQGLLSRAAWGAILCGAVIATAVTILLDFLGLGIGFLVINPIEGAGALGVISIIYIILASAGAHVAGGLAAGRLSGAPSTATAALHGIAVWAVTTIVTVILAVYAAGVVMSGAASALSSASSALANAGQAIAPDDVDLPDLQLPEITMESLPPEIRQAVEDQGLTPDQLRQEAREIADRIVSPRERDQLRSELVDAAAAVIRRPGEAPQIVERTLQDLVGEGGVLSEQDLQEARTQLERRLGITPEQADQLLQRYSQDLEQALAQAEQALNAAGERVTEAADAAADSLAVASWIAFFASVAGFGGAAAGAVAGRPGARPPERRRV